MTSRRNTSGPVSIATWPCPGITAILLFGNTEASISVGTLETCGLSLPWSRSVGVVTLRIPHPPSYGRRMDVQQERHISDGKHTPVKDIL